ncbi:MAG: hypothetical protein JSR56_10645 [Proteobacteria bacterium]|nr:hypothetical protein [Pseudomonadota bacterium]
MEFRVQLAGMHVDQDALQTLLFDIDPAAMVDVDRDGSLRVAAATSTAALAELLHRSGCPVKPAQVLEVPSFCCGGCST